ncbi:MAG: bifunctional 4-hydroxy-3-methylbut-2-enyl diphosphate reductase/30S ribosomal protein S1 [Oscillospiraceae bacterium]
MEIITAKTAGFCFGVRRAVKIAEKAAEEYGSCVCLGPLIHNDDVVRELESRGIRTVHDISEINEGDRVIIRSHGIGRDEYAELESRHVQIIDATCPDVSKIHKLVSQESLEGRGIIIIGEKAHPEVRAIAGWCAGAEVFETPEETQQFFTESEDAAEKVYSVVSQTTAARENFEINVNIIKKECTNSKIFDTICDTTSRRQKEAAELASRCDVMIVIGGRHSANSRKLADICRNHCDRVIFIENASQLDVGLLQADDVVGVTAGASTPEWIIKEVNRKMSDEIMTAEAVENNEAAVDTAAETSEAEASFEELLERSIKTLHTGEKVSGIIASITPTEVSVDLGTKQAGYIPISELTDEPGVNVEDIIKVGDEIEAYVMRVNDVEGTVMLSKKRLDSVKAWDTIAEARNERAVVEGTVIEENKGGIVVSVKGVRVFVPASLSGLSKDAPMTELLKKKVRLRITEVNQPRRRVVGSIRAVANEERRAKAEAIWNEIEVGKRYHGVVKSLTSYGAFVDIGGIDGMVHVSELSWKRIHQPSEVVSVGDEIDVYVISFDKENKKISLGYKDPNENPWVRFTTNYSVGSVAEVKIVKLMTFGAFAEIVPGVDGLIHISQIADRRIGKPDDVLSEGQVVNAKIINIDNENKKVSLSIRALLEPEAPAAAEDDAEPEADDDQNVVVYDTENPPAAEDIDAE